MPPATKPIGGVLKILKEDFPDITISKIRFLEGEGLISPERAPSGYRRYSEHDISRLRYILDVQKNQYLPLKVIRENLEAMDRGEEPVAQAAVVETPHPLDLVPPAASAFGRARWLRAELSVHQSGDLAAFDQALRDGDRLDAAPIQRADFRVRVLEQALAAVTATTPPRGTTVGGVAATPRRLRVALEDAYRGLAALTHPAGRPVCGALVVGVAGGLLVAGVHVEFHALPIGQDRAQLRVIAYLDGYLLGHDSGHQRQEQEQSQPPGQRLPIE